jgi:hypothetical protein
MKSKEFHRVSDVSDKSVHSDDHNLRSPMKSVRYNSQNQLYQPNPMTSSFAGNVKTQTMIECEKRVIDLLEALEVDPDKFSNNLKEFEE